MSCNKPNEEGLYYLYMYMYAACMLCILVLEYFDRVIQHVHQYHILYLVQLYNSQKAQYGILHTVSTLLYVTDE